MATEYCQPMRIGIVGYGTLGKFLAHKILDQKDGGNDHSHGCAMELAFVWNRSAEKVRSDTRIPVKCVVENLSEVWEPSTKDKWHATLIVEVAHPFVCIQHVEQLLSVANVLVGSPNAFADHSLDDLVRRCSLGRRVPGEEVLVVATFARNSLLADVVGARNLVIGC
jgi:predicted dinucleotide-utilizing enzyme